MRPAEQGAAVASPTAAAPALIERMRHRVVELDVAIARADPQEAKRLAQYRLGLAEHLRRLGFHVPHTHIR